MLAAGVGSRLRGEEAGAAEHPPKVLLRFGGRTLLHRHIENLRRAGVEKLALVVGYRAAEIEREIAAARAQDYVETVYNADFRSGSVTSLAAGAAALEGGGDMLLMDADVLYHPRILDRLVTTAHANCFLMDRDFEDGPEPVKLCVRDGALVEFRKEVSGAHDLRGESVGFFRFAPAIAARVAAAARAYVAAGRSAEPYEEVVRDVLLAAPSGTFGYEDVTGLPWIEIDFPKDVERADREVLPRIEGRG